MQGLKTAIVGCGTIAPLHTEALLRRGVEIVALCDVDVARAESLKAKYGLNARVYQDYHQLLSGERLTSVHICTPHYLHAPMAISALKLDINVFLEKPMGISQKDVADVQAAAEASRAQLAVCFQNRYLPINQEAKRIAAENGSHGGYFSVIWARNQQYYNDAPWRGNLKLAGGGALINQAIHTLDLMQWFLGDPVAVTAQTHIRRRLENVDVEDTVEGLIEFASCAVPFYISITAPENYPIKMAFSGKSKVLLEDASLIVNGTTSEFSPSSHPAAKAYWGTGHFMIINDFYNCLQQNKPFWLNHHEGSKSLLTTLKIYKR